jgi:ABC-type transport system involved in multi-copper enzyme maturation permease subunit
MLRKLFLKDVRLNPHLFWGAVPFFVWVAYALGENGAPVGMLTVVSGVMGATTAATVAAREDRFHATALLASLPVPRETLVLSRFVLALAAGAAAFLVAAVLAAALPWSTHTLGSIFDPRTAMLALVIVGSGIAVLLPMALRFGLAGVVGFFAVLQVAGVALFLVASTFGLREPMQIVFGGLESGLRGLHASFGAPGASALALAVLAGVLWSSYRLSVWLTTRRDL